MSKILVSGSLAYDHIMDFPGLFKDHFLANKLHNINVSFNVPDHTEHFGGTAGNIAYNLVLLGEVPTIIATAGRDFALYKTYLKEIGIETDSVCVIEDKQTSFAYVITDEGDNQISAFHPGAGGVPYALDVPATPDAIAIISAGCIDDIRNFPDIYRGNGTPFLFDPAQSLNTLTADEVRNGITDADVVFGNDYEMEMIRVKTGWGEKEILDVAKTLVVTLGSEGSRIITKAGETKIPAVTTKELKDPTGAGDAYRAGYIKGMRMGKDPVGCAKLGSAVAVYAIEHIGTQKHTFTLVDLKERYEGAYGETIQF